MICIDIRLITYNRPNNVRRVLDQISGLDTGNFSITVFDNSTNSETSEVVRRYQFAKYIKTGYNIGFRKNYFSAIFNGLDHDSISMENSYIWIIADDDDNYQEVLSNIPKLLTQEINPELIQLANSDIPYRSERFYFGDDVIRFYQDSIRSKYIPCGLISDILYKKSTLQRIFKNNSTQYMSNLMNNNFPQTALVLKILESRDITMYHSNYNISWVPQRSSSFSLYMNYLSLRDIYQSTSLVPSTLSKSFLSWLSLSYASCIIKSHFLALLSKRRFETDDGIREARSLIKEYIRVRPILNLASIKLIILTIMVFTLHITKVLSK